MDKKSFDGFQRILKKRIASTVQVTSIRVTSHEEYDVLAEKIFCDVYLIEMERQ